MAFITKSDLRPFIYIKMTAEDYRNLAEITRKRKMKRGETGYTAVQIRNFTLLGSTCSPDMKQLILEYFTEKLNKKKAEIKTV